MSLLQPVQCHLTSDSSRSITFDADLTCVGTKGPSFEQRGQFTVLDAAMHSVRNLVHTSALHVVFRFGPNRYRTVRGSTQFDVRFEYLSNLSNISLKIHCLVYQRREFIMMIGLWF